MLDLMVSCLLLCTNELVLTCFCLFHVRPDATERGESRPE